MANSSRMTSFQRREQLIEVGRTLFATKGFEAVSVEEIAASAKVSKPIVYEHFGGKEGLYAVVVDREMRALTDALARALSNPDAHPRQIVERTALALLTYIEEDSEGFQVLVRDSPSTDPAGSFSSLLGDVSLRVEEILTSSFKRLHLPSKGAPYYAQMLVGMAVFTGQYWADRRKISKEQLAAHIVNLAWYGLSRLEAKPELRFESEKARRAARQDERATREATEKTETLHNNANTHSSERTQHKEKTSERANSRHKSKDSAEFEDTNNIEDTSNIENGSIYESGNDEESGVYENHKTQEGTSLNTFSGSDVGGVLSAEVTNMTSEATESESESDFNANSDFESTETAQ